MGRFLKSNVEMRVIEDLSQFPKPLSYPVMAIGVFDGVHRGHQAILKSLLERTREKKGTSVLLTFSPHPQKIISSGDAPPLLQTQEQKEELLRKLKIDILVRLPFTRSLSLYTPEQFALKILYNHGIREIFVGSNFRFGHRRSGDVAMLRSMGEKFGFEVHEINPVYFRGTRISSTLVRKLLREGRVSLAKRMLNRPYQIQGIVVRGAGKGIQLGFPTANLEVENELIPANGVYAGRVEIDGKVFPSVTNIGHRPTLHQRAGERPVVETHLLDFREDVYGRPIKLELCLRLRPEKKFSGPAELRKQIERDIKKTRKYRTRICRILEEEQRADWC